MSDYYTALRGLHIACAFATISLFALRGGLMLADTPWQRSAVLRYLPHAVDTLLLATAVMLTMAIRQYPFTSAWLTTKVLLLVAYIVLGSIALKRGRTKRARAVAFVAALLTVGFLVTVARAHDPLGFLTGLNDASVTVSVIHTYSAGPVTETVTPAPRYLLSYRNRNTGT